MDKNPSPVSASHLSPQIPPSAYGSATPCVERSVLLPLDLALSAPVVAQDGINNDALLIDDCNGNPAPHHW